MLALPPFSTHALIESMREHGCTFRLQDGAPRVRFSATCPATPGLLEELRTRRAEIVALLEQDPEAGGSEFGDRLAQRLQEAERDRAEMHAMGTARMLIQRVREAGGRIRLTGDGSILVSPKPSDPETVEALRRAKPELLALLAREQEQER